MRMPKLLSALFAVSTASFTAQAACFDPALLKGAEVVALGAYEGGTEVAFSFGDEPHATTTIMVGANKNGAPLLLVLTAYDPVIWNLKAVPAGRIKGILVYGYHEQDVTGLTAPVPVQFSTREHTSAECGKPVYAYKGGSDLERLDGRVEMLFGKRIRRFHGAYGPESLHADLQNARRLTPMTQLSGKTLSSSPLSRSAIPPGDAGLRVLMATGAIRPARQADINRWNAAATAASSTGHLAPVENEYLRLEDTYVVTRKIQIPAGMYGANSASFIIPQGIAMPTDNGSHNSYWYADGTCAGPPDCSRRRR